MSSSSTITAYRYTRNAVQLYYVHRNQTKSTSLHNSVQFMFYLLKYAHSTACSDVLDIFSIFKEHILEKKVSRAALFEELLTDIDHVFKMEQAGQHQQNMIKKRYDKCISIQSLSKPAKLRNKALHFQAHIIRHT